MSPSSSHPSGAGIKPLPARRVTILCVGSELVEGRILDTNGGMLTRYLAGVGIRVRTITCVGDYPTDLEAEIRRGWEEADGIIISGGLGSTFDDLTRHMVAGILGEPLEFREPWREGLLQWLRGRASPPSEEVIHSTLEQAKFPMSAKVFPNPIGTAAPFRVNNRQGKPCLCLPGVPQEIEGIMSLHKINELLFGEDPAASPLPERTTLRFFNLPENQVDLALRPIIEAHPNLNFSILASLGEIIVSFFPLAHSVEATQQAASARQALSRLFPDHRFTFDDRTLFEVAATTLTQRGERLKILDSFTRGYTAQSLQQALGRECARVQSHVLPPMPQATDSDILTLAKGVEDFTACLVLAGLAPREPATPSRNPPRERLKIAILTPRGALIHDEMLSGSEEMIKIRGAKLAAWRLIRYLEVNHG